MLRRSRRRMTVLLSAFSLTAALAVGLPALAANADNAETVDDEASTAQDFVVSEA